MPRSLEDIRNDLNTVNAEIRQLQHRKNQLQQELEDHREYTLTGEMRHVEKEWEREELQNT